MNNEQTKRNRSDAIEPGGCECHICGCIFIGDEWMTECAVCHADSPAPQPPVAKEQP